MKTVFKLTAEGINKTYKTPDGHLEVLRSVDLEVTKPGCFIF